MLTVNQRKCRKCGVIINYAKGDVKAGRIPNDPICPKCERREKKNDKFKPDNPFGELNGEKEQTSEPDNVPVLRESFSSGKKRKDNNRVPEV